MASRTQIERISRQIEKLAAKHEAATHVPPYGNETEAEALRAYGQPVSGSVVFNRARVGDREVRRILAQIDGNTRGILTMQNLTSERGSTT
jgi:hypothetical protein